MHLIFFISGILTILTACEENREALPTNRFGESITLDLGESVDIQEDLMTLSFEKLVEDSRCPNGVDCFWEGQAIVQFLINKTNTLELTMRTGHEDLAKDTLNNFIYTLEAVNPYPDITNELPIPEENYKVSIRVDKL